MKMWAQRLEIVTNIAILGMLCLLLAAFLWRFWHSPQPRGQHSLVGTRLDIPQVRRSPMSIVLAIDSRCRYCTESAPFYRRLTNAASSKRVNTIAVLPQAESVASQYLSEKALRFDTIVSLPLETIGVRNTPSVILVDSNGNVMAAWVGKLSEAQESDVMSRF